MYEKLPENSVESKIEPTNAAKRAQAIVEAYYEFGKGYDPIEGCTSEESHELRDTASREFIRLKAYSELDDCVFTVASCENKDNPLIVFKLSPDGHNVEVVRKLEGDETFKGKMSVEPPFIKIADPKAEYVVLSAGAMEPEFKIIDLSCSSVVDFDRYMYEI